MKVLRTAIAVLAMTGLAAGAVAASSAKLKGAELTGQAKLKLSAARVIALKVRPGTITDQELEREKGGSGLRYSFVISSHGKPYEVGVDARDGKVLENVPEGKNPD